jgi:hypothetical protein
MDGIVCVGSRSRFWKPELLGCANARQCRHGCPAKPPGCRLVYPPSIWCARIPSQCAVPMGHRWPLLPAQRVSIDRIGGNLFHDPVSGEQFYIGSNLAAGRPLYYFDKSLPGGRMLNGGQNVADGAFQLPTGDSEGNTPRNIARGFGAQQLSLALRRDIHLYDRFYLQLRGDVFKVSNSPDFGYIVPPLSNQLFGQLTLSLNQSYGQSGSLYQPGCPRSLQWMFRVRW